MQMMIMPLSELNSEFDVFIVKYILPEPVLVNSAVERKMFSIFFIVPPV